MADTHCSASQPRSMSETRFGYRASVELSLPHDLFSHNDGFKIRLSKDGISSHVAINFRKLGPPFANLNLHTKRSHLVSSPDVVSAALEGHTAHAHQSCFALRLIQWIKQSLNSLWTCLEHVNQ